MCKVLCGGIHKQVMQRSQLTKKPRKWHDYGSNDKGPQHVSYTCVTTENCTLLLLLPQAHKTKEKAVPYTSATHLQLLQEYVSHHKQIDHTFFILQQNPVCFVNIQAAVSLVSIDPLLSWLGVQTVLANFHLFFRLCFEEGAAFHSLITEDVQRHLWIVIWLKEINIFWKLKSRGGGGVSIFVLPLFFN